MTNLNNLGPAWMIETAPSTPAPTAKPDVSELNKLGPAWMLGGALPPSIQALPTAPTPASLPSLPPLPQFPPLPGLLSTLPPLPSVIPAIPISFPASPVPNAPPSAKPSVPAPATPIAKTPPIVPTIVVSPEIVAPPKSTATDWKSVVQRYLQAVATDKGSTAFQAWANDPAAIFALVYGESGGDRNAVHDEGYSSKLKRNYFAFGLFQMNEIWGAAYQASAVARIGPKLAQQMPAFPKTTSWTKEQAANALLAWPGQVLYAMVLLAQFANYKAAYFTSMKGQVATPAQHLTSSDEQKHATDAAAGINALAKSTGVPAELIALKAYWLGSSPAYVAKATLAKDPRIIATARQWMKK